jgi:hypothetical protein
MRRLRRHSRIAAVAAVAVVLSGAVALAYFQAPGAGSATASVGSLGAPSGVSAIATPGSSTVPVSWTASPEVNGVSPQGYYVVRNTGGADVAAACGTSASSLTTATTCDDSDVPDGTYTYTVLAKYRSLTASATSAEITVANDDTDPTVTVEQNSGQADPTKVLPIRLTVTFSEPVSDFTASDLVRGGTSSGGTVELSGSGTSYEIAMSGTLTDGTLTFSVPAGAATAAAGNASTASTSTDNTVTYDTTAPALTLTSPADGLQTKSGAPTIAGAAGNAPGDATTVTAKIYAGTGTDGALVRTLTATRTDATWSAATSPALGDGTYTVQATQSDAAGNVATSATSTFTIDRTAPTVTVNQKAGQNDPTNALPIRYTVTFSKPVTGLTTTDLVRGGTSSGGTVVLSGSGASYEITVSGTPTNGTLSFALGAGAAQDAAGNASTASTSTDNTVTYDTVAPAVTLIEPATNNTGPVPVIRGAAGAASGDLTTITVKIYIGTGTGGTVSQTLTPTRSGATWSAAPAPLANGGTYTVQATQADSAGNTGTSTARTFTIGFG